MTRKTYSVKVAKRDTGEIVEGEIQDDGLQSLWPVKTADGEIRYVSVLDTFLSKTPVAR